MKKNIIRSVGLLSAATVIVLASVGCSKKDDVKPTDDAQATVAPSVDTPATLPMIDESKPVVVDNFNDADMAKKLAAVLVNTYGENYIATELIDAELLESMYDIAPDMYDNSFAATSMMSAHVDKVIMLHSDDTAPVLEKLNAYLANVVADTMAYPSNLPKNATAQVVDFENGWVGFFLLGGYADMDVEETWATDEDAVAFYKDLNQKGIDAVKQYFLDGVVPDVDVSTVIAFPGNEQEVEILGDEIDGTEEAIDEVVDSDENLNPDAETDADVVDDADSVGVDGTDAELNAETESAE